MDPTNGCEGGDGVWTGDSSDDKETGEAPRSSRNENGKVSLGVTREDKITSEGHLKV